MTFDDILITERELLTMLTSRGHYEIKCKSCAFLNKPNLDELRRTMDFRCSFCGTRHYIFGVERLPVKMIKTEDYYAWVDEEDENKVFVLFFNPQKRTHIHGHFPATPEAPENSGAFQFTARLAMFEFVSKINSDNWSQSEIIKRANEGYPIGLCSFMNNWQSVHGRDKKVIDI